MRAGLILQKIGMTRVFEANGKQIPVTVLKADALSVVGQRTVEKDGYCALQIGATKAKSKHLNNAQIKDFEKKGIEAKRKIAEFRVSSDNLLPVGTQLNVDHFSEGQFVDASGLTIGKGFQGVMKRHNFGGLRASHGVSISHRTHGSTGGRQDPGRVFKNKKMAGHYGVEQVTIQNLQVIKVDSELGVLLVKGAVPGAKGSFLMIEDAIKKTGKTA